MPEVLPYHLKVCNHFKQQTKTWDFFASSQTRNEQLEIFKLEVLKNTYQFDRTADSNIYDKIEIAKNKLGLEKLKVSVYQQQFTDEINASIIYLDQEAHIVFSGRIIQLLNEEELLAVLAHELAHVKLFSMINGDLEITDRIITAIANNHQTEAAYYETARLFRLYTEIFCDRGAYAVLENTAPVITSLVKIATGLDKVSAESFVRQANEIFTVEKTLKSSTITHPENFIRARAIQLWHDNKESAEEEIIKMIEGSVDLDQLDIFKQKELAKITLEFMQLFLKPKWIQSVLVISQAKQFFSDFSFDEKATLSLSFADQILASNDSIKDYLCYILLDFILIDPSLESIPFGWGFQFAEDLMLKEQFDVIVKKEFKYSDKKLQQLKQSSLAAYYAVKESAVEQIYED